MKNKTYYLFIDESGNPSLNFVSDFFVLSAVVIDKDDFEIIEGYLRLLKRKYLKNDLKNLHATDLFERPYLKYRRLIKPKNILLGFTDELRRILNTVPYKVALYYVKKDKMIKKLKYKPASKKKTVVNLDLPYELCSREAINDFCDFLMRNRALGEIIIESRMYKDSDFVKYFDNARKPYFPGKIPNNKYKNVIQKINSLLIANKRIVNGGLEIADACSYVTYRHLAKDRGKVLKINLSHLAGLYNVFKKKTFVSDSSGCKIKEVKL